MVGREPVVSRMGPAALAALFVAVLCLRGCAEGSSHQVGPRMVQAQRLGREQNYLLVKEGQEVWGQSALRPGAPGQPPPHWLCQAAQRVGSSWS